MGIDTEVFVRKNQIKKLLNNFDDLIRLYNLSFKEWELFKRQFGIFFETKSLSSEELVKHLAMTDDIEESKRTEIVSLCLDYDLIFAPETEETAETDYIEIWKIVHSLCELGKQNLKKLMERAEKTR